MAMTITLLGTGSPTPSARRAGSGYLVETAGELFVFDCGPGSYVRFLQAGQQPTQVTQVFITHWHYDHCTDLPHYVLQRWDQGAGRIPELKIYGPRPVRRIVRSLFGPRGVFGPDLDARTGNEASLALYVSRGGTPPRRRPDPEVAEMRHASQVRGKDWTVRAIEVPHAQPSLRCLAYRLDSPDGSFVYSGDSGPTRRMVSFAQGADVLVHMCHYLTGTHVTDAMLKGCGSHRMVASLAQEAGVGTVVLTHITGQIDVAGVRERTVHEVSEIFDGTVILAEDLLRIGAGQADILDCFAELRA